MVRTLVVDDEPAICDLVVHVLRRAGHDVASAHDGAAALEALAGDAYDLLVIDHHVPGATGTAVLIELLRAGSSTRVVLMSSDHARSSLPREAHGQATFLTKPFDRASLLAAVDEVMDGRTRDGRPAV